MIRETKRERVVRTMTDPVLDHLHELKAIEADPNAKELDVERWCQSMLRGCLGFSATNGYAIHSQEAKGRHRPDLVILKGDRPVCVVEIKKLGFDLNKSALRSGKVQLNEYLRQIGTVNWGILCNGYDWRLYDFSDPSRSGVNVVSVNLQDEQGGIDLSKRHVEDICWDLVDLHESMLASGGWNEFAREATAFSPESLARAVLSVETVKYVARIIRGEHDYRANPEVLFDKLHHLLESGLSLLVTDWNEVKQAELNKYISSQKKARRKKSEQAGRTDRADAQPETARGAADQDNTPIKVITNKVS